MSSLLDLASLVLAPTATKEGKVYSAIPDTGEGDMTFTRGSSATRVNSAGLIEKERANLLLQSNTFNTTWSTSNASVTGGQSGYDGSSDAWLLQNNAGYTTAVVKQNFSLGSAVRSFSVYAKAGNVNFLRILMYDGANTYVSWFNLTDGSISDESNIIDAKSTSVGGGWYRCEISANTNIANLNIYPSAVAGSSLTDDGDYIYIQDAMLNQGLVAQSYIETTTTAVYEGITDDVPRVDYSGGGCPSLLLEPQRTNLITQSEYFDAWIKEDISITSNVAISPEGLQNASKLTPNTNNTDHTIYQAISGSGDRSFSVFAKAAGYDFVFVGDNNTNVNDGAIFNLSEGTIALNTSGYNASIEDFGNGWYKCSVYGNFSSVYSCICPAEDGTTFDFAGDGTSGIYVYGGQWEQGSYPTSYIPTYGTSTSRSADSCSLTNASNLIGQSEGTLFFQLKDTNNLTAYLGVDNGSTGTRILIYGINDQKIYTQVRNSGTVIFSASSSVISGGVKVAVSFDSSGSVFYVNGLQVSTGSGTTYTNLSQVTFNHSSQIGVKMKQAILFPTRLTNDQLEELTK